MFYWHEKNKPRALCLDRGSGLPAPIQESSRFSPRAFLLSCWCDEIVQIPVRKRKAKTLLICPYVYIILLVLCRILLFCFTMQNYNFYLDLRKLFDLPLSGDF